MPESIQMRINASSLDQMSKRELSAIIMSLRGDVVAVSAALNAVLAKLDADAGVTDTNYLALHEVQANTNP